MRHVRVRRIKNFLAVSHYRGMIVGIMPFEIKPSQPMPEAVPFRNSKYPWDKLQVGESIYFPFNEYGPQFDSIRSAAYLYAKRHGITFKVGRMPDKALQVARVELGSTMPITLPDVEPSSPVNVPVPNPQRLAWFEWLDTLLAGQPQVLTDAASLAMRTQLIMWTLEYNQENFAKVDLVQGSDSITVTFAE